MTAVNDDLYLRLSNLARDTSHKGVVVECPELRLWPTLPPAAASLTAKSFDDLDDLSAKFGRMRDHSSVMHTAATEGTVRSERRNTKNKRAMHQPGVASTGSATHEANHQTHQTHSTHPPSAMETHTFLKCILEVTDPSFQLLSQEDAEKCLSVFMQRASSMLTLDRQNIASTYVSLFKSRRRKALEVTVDDVLESLRDPDAALSDEGLHDAVIMMLSNLLRVHVVVASQCVERLPAAFGPMPSSPTDPAVLIMWDPDRKSHSLHDCGGIANLQAVRNKLLEGQTNVSALLGDAGKLNKMTVDELQTLATRVALSTPKQYFPTKSTIVDALLAIERTRGQL